VTSDGWARWVADAIAGSAWLTWLSSVGMGSILIWGSGIAAMAVLLPILFVTVSLVAEIVAMPVIVACVGDRHYAALEKKAGGTIAGSALNAAAGIGVFGLLWLATLPLWLTGIAAFVLPPLLSAYLNQRLFRYDALSEHASTDEYRALTAGAGGRLYLLGLLLAPLYYVPLLNLVAPVLGGLAFTHFCLAELVRLRALNNPVVPRTDETTIRELRRLGGLLKKVHVDSRGAYSTATAAALADLHAAVRVLARGQ